MNIILKGHDKKYEIESIALLFFPCEKFYYTLTPNDNENITVKSRLKESNGYSVCQTEISGKDKKTKGTSRIKGTGDKARQGAMKRSFYYAGVKFCGIRPPWGVLTGIRPAKLAYELAKGQDFIKAKRILKKDYLVSPQKTQLCIDVAENRANLNLKDDEKSVSLYIAIPFCPTRCDYCSFTSHSIQSAKKLIPQYVELLCKEIKATAGVVKKLDLSLETIYIGGGTPSILSVSQIEDVMSTIKASFNLSKIKEYTFEAGRPDTLTDEKLRAILRGGADRISINPQTLNDEILTEIGRKHTSSDFLNAYALAKNIGFKAINTDLIAGLPKDNFKNFKNSIDTIIKMAPENITIHTLCIKRASNLNTKSKTVNPASSEETTNQLDYAHSVLKENNYLPYYMYRQKNTVGNLENTGYSKSGFEGIYNIIMMDETHTVLGCGAGAVTKLVAANGNLIERIFNPKYPYEYLEHINKIIKNKEKVIKFYVGKR